jgi:hypothetical protein
MMEPRPKHLNVYAMVAGRPLPGALGYASLIRRASPGDWSITRLAAIGRALMLPAISPELLRAVLAPTLPKPIRRRDHLRLVALNGVVVCST